MAGVSYSRESPAFGKALICLSGRMGGYPPDEIKSTVGVPARPGSLDTPGGFSSNGRSFQTDSLPNERALAAWPKKTAHRKPLADGV